MVVHAELQSCSAFASVFFFSLTHTNTHTHTLSLLHPYLQWALAWTCSPPNQAARCYSYNRIVASRTLPRLFTQ
jgi:hypothetical protein